jgi:hypothetical protein
LLCADADAALDNGIPLGQVLVDVLPAAVPDISQDGVAALVDVDRAAGLAARHNPAGRDLAAREPTGGGHTDLEPAGSGLTPVAGIIALAALSSWLGARAVRTRYPAPVRHALDMTASVRGIRPPTRTVRGLA